MKSSFLSDFKKIFTSKQVWIGLAATMILLILFRFGATVLLPNINPGEAITKGNATNISFLDIMSLISGSGSGMLSFFSVGVSPYITAQIIIQLLSTDVIKPLARLSKSGEKGRRKIEIITRLLSIPFAVAQGYAMFSISITQGLISVGEATTINDVSALDTFKILLALTSGSVVSLFIADIITKRGIGNGITLLILSGVLSQIFFNFKQVYDQVAKDPISSNDKLIGYLIFASYIALFLILLTAVIFVNGAIRKIPIQQTGNSMNTNINEMAFLPIKVNAAGVIPVIFASSIVTIPTTFMQIVDAQAALQLNEWIGLDKPIGMTIYAVLIIAFSFFYSYVQLNPEQIAENFQKSGKYIPGIKSGRATEKYISRVLIRINFIGAPFLAIIAIIPYIISATTSISSGIAVGGTGIIIMVSGATDFWQALLSAQTNYKYTKTKKDIQQSYIEDESSSSDNKVTHLW